MPFEHAIRLAGLGQLTLAAASTTFPHVLRWPEELAKLRPMLRRVFWIYAGYILGFNLSFGLVSLLRPEWLLATTPLAAGVSGFIAVYWGTRLLLQLAFDRADIPAGARYRWAEAALVTLFVFLTVVYATALVLDVRG